MTALVKDSTTVSQNQALKGQTMANHLPLDKKLLVLSALVEGASIRSVERISGVHRDTIMRLMVSVGERAAEIMDRDLVNLKSRFVQADEIWCYVGKKQRLVTDEERKAGEKGDQYVFVAMDAETKLIPCFTVGKRTAQNTLSFLRDLNYRISNRFQLSTDSFAPYQDAVDRVWGEDIDYGQVHKRYGETPELQKRYSPSQIVSVTIRPVAGQPLRKHISTSYVERQNLTIRMQMRRFTRLTNAFSKRLTHLRAALALHFFHYNFMRIHQTLRVTPAMQAGVSNHVWTWAELLGISALNRKAA